MLSENNRRYSKTCAIIIIMEMRLEMKNRSHRYDINETWPSHGHKYKPQYDYGYIY